MGICIILVGECLFAIVCVCVCVCLFEFIYLCVCVCVCLEIILRILIHSFIHSL